MKRLYSILLDPAGEAGGGGASEAHKLFEAPAGDPNGGAGGGEGQGAGAGTREGAGSGSGEGAPAGAGEGAGAGAPAAGSGAPAAAPGFTPEQLEQVLTKAISASRPAGAPAGGAGEGENKRYSQEDFDRVFQVAKVTQEDVASILAGGEGALTTLNKLTQSAARQAIVMAAFQMQEMRETLEKRYEPIESTYRQQQEKAMFDEFMVKNPGFKGLDSAIQHVVQELRAEKASFKTKDEAFKTVVDRTTKFIRSLPGFDKWEPGQPFGTVSPNSNDSAGSGSPTGGKSSMPALSRGGQGGAGSGQGGTGGKAKSPGQAVFM